MNHPPRRGWSGGVKAELRLGAQPETSRVRLSTAARRPMEQKASTALLPHLLQFWRQVILAWSLNVSVSKPPHNRMLISCLIKGIQMSLIMTGVHSICRVLYSDDRRAPCPSVIRVCLTNYTIFTTCLWDKVICQVINNLWNQNKAWKRLKRSIKTKTTAELGDNLLDCNHHHPPFTLRRVIWFIVTKKSFHCRFNFVFIN